MIVLNGSAVGFPELTLPAFTLTWSCSEVQVLCHNVKAQSVVITVISVKLEFTLLLTLLEGSLK